MFYKTDGKLGGDQRRDERGGEGAEVLLEQGGNNIRVVLNVAAAEVGALARVEFLAEHRE